MSASGGPAERAAARTTAGVTGYQRRLLAAVTASTFFEGFDQAILALAAPYVARDFGLGPDGLGVLLSLIGVGAVLALLITAQADRYGRRRLLLITVAGYGICTGLTALAQRPPTSCCGSSSPGCSCSRNWRSPSSSSPRRLRPRAAASLSRC
ncbi:MAG: MFS transporter [Betaproteobacteria bacterium]|nr:MFS transporter [Betaproteobacteria bacterium]